MPWILSKVQNGRRMSVVPQTWGLPLRGQIFNVSDLVLTMSENFATNLVRPNHGFFFLYVDFASM